jgi:hypothetical protein
MHTEMDEAGRPVEGSGHIAPVVLPDKCVGCGLCQMSCYRVNVQKEDLLDRSAIIIEAGEGKEDRLITGSYIDLRQEEARQREAEQKHKTGGTGSEYYVPEIPSESSDPLPTLDVPNIDSLPSGEGGAKDTAPPKVVEENPFY